MPQPIRILHLEDSLLDADIIQDQLVAEGLNCKIVNVQSGEQFESVLAQDSFDVILCDYNLPGYDGLAALKRVRETHPATPFLLISGSLGEEEAVNCLLQGATDYLLKQRLERLPSAVQRALQEADEQRKRAQAEAELRESEERFRQLAEHSSEAFRFVAVNPERVLYASPATERIWGLRTEQFYQNPRSWLAAVHTDDQARINAAWDACVKGLAAQIEVEYRVVRADGTLRWVLDSCTSIRNESGEIVRVSGVTRDITERKNAEAELERLAAVVEQTADSIVITDPEGRIQYVNPAFEFITGYEKEDVLNQNPRMFKGTKTDPAVYKDLWATITRGAVWKGQLNNRKKDGSYIDELVTISPVSADSGEIISYVAVKQDITAQLRLEEQFRQSQKLEAIGHLAAGVAHDFNNLLTVIGGYAELLLDRLPPERSLRDPVTEIKLAGERASALTRQLLAFSRKQILQPKLLDLNLLISNLEKMLRRLIGEDIDLVITGSPDLGQVKADPGQLEQVILNLMINARDAMPNGGTLTIETANAELTNAYEQVTQPVIPGHYVVFTVTDTGVGMDAETQSHVFEPFFTTKSADQGTGLGLSTVYGIVKQSGGHIWLQSEPAHGTTFKIYLPEIAEGRSASTVHRAPTLSTGTETVLVIEDEEQVRLIVEAILNAAGYKTLVAGTGAQALAIVQERAGMLDLIITDVVMPHMSGPELMKKLLVFCKDVKVLYMSGYTDDAMVRHGLLDESLSFIQKPFTASTLTRQVRDVLDAGRLP